MNEKKNQEKEGHREKGREEGRKDEGSGVDGREGERKGKKYIS